MRRYVSAILRAIGQELKTGAVVMLFLLPVGLLIAVPVVLLVLYLPDWAWFTLFGCGLMWLMFGDAVMGAIKRENLKSSQKSGGADV